MSIIKSLAGVAAAAGLGIGGLMAPSILQPSSPPQPAPVTGPAQSSSQALVDEYLPTCVKGSTFTLSSSRGPAYVSAEGASEAGLCRLIEPAPETTYGGPIGSAPTGGSAPGSGAPAGPAPAGGNTPEVNVDVHNSSSNSSSNSNTNSSSASSSANDSSPTPAPQAPAASPPAPSAPATSEALDPTGMPPPPGGCGVIRNCK